MMVTAIISQHSFTQAHLEYREGDPEWCSDEQVSFETQAKVLGIRLLVSWLVGLESDFEHFASPVLRLLDMVLAHDGDLQGDDNIRYCIHISHSLCRKICLSVFVSWSQCS